MQCVSPACLHICPSGAITLEEATGAKIIEHAKCIGCRMCMLACPFGAVTVDPITKKVIKCDLCEGDPACAKFCPTGAIEYLTADVYGLMRQREAVKQLNIALSALEKGGA